ncbi:MULTISPECIES: phosphoglycerate mutase family protein [Acinetobacter]|jgi:phosphohistidine phosphatase|uniref:Phosphohistidine phosphatase SixA n=1 Tax=Acinetobacter schindleri CIP 107287 TaxID=1217988 RepID=N8Z5Y2_9GAMM|nr:MULTISPECIES: phosphoglycerate mutase family protein [Acinetobacter]APX62487.1 histidine phosphatase family protein [Acinetobacter schindleri]AWD71017.1 phosphohistidine phosphatase [Acinetobacter schindleri]EIM38570.1 putative phosphohistidine phosphatase [Acinetobacter sp. HA]ENV44356.1 phosphohistidine phosphatase SixA [Acinetobacter schindleri CIP 107287]KMU99323.1 phosphohistidine phosphatase [Acinetobacter sp. VT 511]
MQLTLVRHGEAAPPVNGNDTKRPLTERGHLQAEQTAQYLKDIVKPEVFVVSPLLRAQETLAHLQAFYKDVPVVICNAIKPDDDAKVAVEWLSQLPYESIVVVCHMNVVAHIASILTAESFHPFHLSEARIYDQAVIAAGLSTQLKSFIPTV